MFEISSLPSLGNKGLIYNHTCLGKTHVENAADVEARLYLGSASQLAKRCRRDIETLQICILDS